MSSAVMRLLDRVHLLAAMLPLCASSAVAQGDTARVLEPVSQQWRAGIFVGVAHNSPLSKNLGATPGRDHVFVGLQAVTSVVRLADVSISYGAQLLPLVAIRGRSVPLSYIGPTNPDGTLPGPDVTYAVGASPFGLEVAAPLGGRVRAYGAAAAGALLFTRPFPVPEARRLNFTLEYGGGVLVRSGRDRWIQLGYKYHHLSNAYTAKLNPGLDANVFYAGYEWSVRLPR
ncbi:MAG TPA: acyloxyacyl hydrolase [Gemmatimonadaceae bacterium]|jgi:hypothetical protein